MYVPSSKKMPLDAVVVNLDEEWDLIRRGRDDPLPTLPSERARRRARYLHIGKYVVFVSLSTFRITLHITRT